MFRTLTLVSTVVAFSLMLLSAAQAQPDTEAVLILNQNAQDAGDSQLILLSGPDDATIRALNELETRIVLMPPGPNDPIPVSTSAVVTISSPGSYVLGGNVVGVAKKHGIEITVSNVTLDLNGYTLDGSGVTSRHGITSVRSEEHTSELQSR